MRKTFESGAEPVLEPKPAIDEIRKIRSYRVNGRKVNDMDEEERAKIEN